MINEPLNIKINYFSGVNSTTSSNSMFYQLKAVAHVIAALNNSDTWS